MPDPDDGRQPDEGAEGMFGELNRKSSALDRLRAETEDRLAELQRRQAEKDAQIADVQRRQEALNRKLDRWGAEFADLMDGLVRRLAGTSEQLSRADGTLSDIAERHPESEPQIAALRTDLRAEAQRLGGHVDLMREMAHRVTGLEPAGTSKRTTPQIPYDSKLKFHLACAAGLPTITAFLLSLARLFPITTSADRLIGHVVPSLYALSIGVSIAGVLFVRRARVHGRTRT